MSFPFKTSEKSKAHLQKLLPLSIHDPCFDEFICGQYNGDGVFSFKTEAERNRFEEYTERIVLQREMKKYWKNLDDKTQLQFMHSHIETLKFKWQKTDICRMGESFHECTHMPLEGVKEFYQVFFPLEETQEIVTSKSERIASILHGVVKLFDNNDQCDTTLALLCGMVGCDMPHSLIDCTTKIITLPPNKLAMLEDVVTSKPGSLLVQLFQMFCKISVNQWHVLAGLVGEKEIDLSKGLLKIYQRVAQRLTEMEDTSIVEAFLKKIE